MKHVKWLLALALLALPVAVGAQSVVQDGQSFRGVVQQQSVGGILRADSTGKMLTMDSNGNLLVYNSNPTAGLAFYQANAMGPTSIREGTILAGTGSGTTPHWGDSTMVIETRGARRIEVWLYAVFDSANANADSALGVVFAVLPKAHLSTTADSAGSAHVIMVETDSVSSSLSKVAAVYQPFVAGATSSGAIHERVLQGEFAVVYSRSWGAQAGKGIPPWAKFDICAKNGCFSSEYISLRFRILGHVRQWPQATLNVVHSYRYTVRVDVKGYYQ